MLLRWLQSRGRVPHQQKEVRERDPMKRPLKMLFQFLEGALHCPDTNRLTGLVVKASASGVEDPGFKSCLRWDFCGSSHTSDFCTPLATLPGAWQYRVSTGTGRLGDSILWLGEVESLIHNFYLSVAARKNVWADPSLRYTSMLLGC